MRRLSAQLAAAVMLALTPLTAQAQNAPAAPPVTPALPLRSAFETMALRLHGLLLEGAALEPAFTPEFLAAIPIEQLRETTAALRTQYGEPQSIGSVTRGPGEGQGTVRISYAQADVTFALAVDNSGRIAGLQITDVATSGDTVAQLATELAALPGQVGWGLYRLNATGAPERIAGANTTQSLAIGSSFKLAVLGALDVEIAAGRMRWSDVILLDRVSVPSGITQSWPIGTPITLQSAATLMMSISDNSATDLLIRHIGRERVEAFARANGGLDGPRAFPLLTTIEWTVLKNPALGEARTGWLNGDEAQRRAVLARHAPLFVPGNVDYAAFARPASIDTIEWFASADSVARLLGWYAYRASDTARAVIAVNPGLPAGNAAQWRYVGFKGGSEPGVVALNLLLRDEQGTAYAVVMSWNNPAASVEEARLVGLAARAAALLRARSTP